MVFGNPVVGTLAIDIGFNRNWSHESRSSRSPECASLGKDDSVNLKRCIIRRKAICDMVILIGGSVVAMLAWQFIGFICGIRR